MSSFSTTTAAHCPAAGRGRGRGRGRSGSDSDIRFTGGDMNEEAPLCDEPPPLLLPMDFENVYIPADTHNTTHNIYNNTGNKLKYNNILPKLWEGGKKKKKRKEKGYNKGNDAT